MAVRPALSVLLMATALLGGHAARADEPVRPVDATRLVALLVADTDDPEIGSSVGVDVQQFRWSLDQGVPPGRLAVHVMTGADATPQTLLARVRSVDVAPTDTLLVYYAGHGAWADAGPYLRLHGQVLPRADLVAAMRARGAGLSILLTDCCSTYVGKTYLFAPPTVDPDRYRDLFFRPRGFVDVTAAARGQVAVGDGNLGGVFTKALTDLLTLTPRAALDVDRDGVVSWGETVDALTRGTKDVFTMLHPRGLTVGGRPVGGQTPFVFGPLAAPAAPIPPPSKRLGVQTAAIEGGGARVVAVLPDTPAAWMGIAAGDVIVEIRLAEPASPEGGRPVKGPADLGTALQAAGPRGLVVVVTRTPSTTAPGGQITREVPLRLGP